MKKYISVIMAVILTASAAVVCALGSDRINNPVAARTVLNRKSIIIDAGHGGFDGGAVAYDGTIEKDINLSISVKLEKIFSFYGFNVIMTRSTDTSTESKNFRKSKKASDMYNRLQLMNDNPDAIFVSIHLNKFTHSSARGTQVFYSGKPETSDLLAQSIQDSVKKMLQPDNNRLIKKGTKSTYLLYNATVPSAIVECGFLSNKEELQQLKNDDYQSKMAFSIFCGIIDYYNGLK